ncbi:TPA: hypothetical protein N0F65_003164 [Lagenidium giganteum]|uniref:Uncharacterized protein n=1 Tax=Lagenidium giganteum TaxID=4803 RepID=A0AAV2Z9H8_9STRA|nr:TPA: hypothetical protein N0F65_003164 [Lagenidium giganteum]
MERVVRELFAKRVHRVDLVAVLERELDEAHAVFDEHTVLATLKDGRFFEAARDQADVACLVQQTHEVTATHRTKACPLEQVAHNWEPEQVVGNEPFSVRLGKVMAVRAVDEPAARHDAMRMEGKHRLGVGVHQRLAWIDVGAVLFKYGLLELEIREIRVRVARQIMQPGRFTSVRHHGAIREVANQQGHVNLHQQWHGMSDHNVGSHSERRKQRQEHVRCRDDDEGEQAEEQSQAAPDLCVQGLQRRVVIGAWEGWALGLDCVVQGAWLHFWFIQADGGIIGIGILWQWRHDRSRLCLCALLAANAQLGFCRHRSSHGLASRWSARVTTSADMLMQARHRHQRPLFATSMGGYHTSQAVRQPVRIWKL